MPEIVDLKRERSSVERVLVDAVREHERYLDAAVIGYDADGQVFYNMSEMTEAEFICLLLNVLDEARRPA